MHHIVNTTDSRPAARRFGTSERACSLLAICALLLVACGAGANTVDQLAGGATIPAGVTFDADVTITPADVTVDWSVENRSTTELLVPILVSHKDVKPEGNAYVVPAGDHIEIAERLFVWPDEVEELAVTPSVGALRIRPGTTESRTIRVPRPFKPYHPFGGGFDDGPPALPSHPEGVVFCLGVVPDPYPPPLKLDTAKGVEFVAHGWDAQQYRFCTDPVAVE
ncbi:hypothetical protein [Nocardia rhizosphaerihabitans]|uniref:Uncharacterized protein n=1 Tax=Nocardia rhizosphaerihabitans TaxID=1691570 RepID=A0ABQ2KVP8_9NOCA|nr:hypothetical protein [Nocardia rhizosphaerihabitans]GGN94233.1 hypothetical protein GCM10011610_56960 [Nocardia rhizosphaerihabitans]